MQHTEIPLVAEGVPSFLGVPFARTPSDLERASAVVLSIPYDRPATAGRPADQWSGYRHAPADVRRYSLKYGGYLPELDLDVFEHLRLVDYGNADIVDGDDTRCIENVSRKVREVLDAGCALITLGGFSPCASYAVVKGIAESTRGRVGVLSLDAHGDTLDEEPQGGVGPASSTWEARMWDHFRNVDPRHHVEIGVRGPRNTRQQIEAYRKRGAHLWTAPSIHQTGVEALCLDALPYALRDVERRWLHLDMDVLDISASPDWGR